MDDGGTFYDTGIEGIVDQTLAWTRDEIRVCLLRKGYGFNPAHTTLADVVANAAGFSDVLTGRRVQGRNMHADDTTVLATANTPVNQIVVYRAGRTPSTARLVLHTYFPEIKPLVGQLVEVPWPEGVVATF